MTYSLYRATRSVRLTVTIPDGNTVTVENLVGDSGFSMEFECTRTMDESLGSGEVRVYNLPGDVIAILEGAQLTKIDDIDRILAGQQLQTAAVAPSGDDALGAGLLVASVFAGYDGNTSRVFTAVGAKSSSGYISDGQSRDLRGRFVRQQGGLTYQTTIRATDALDGVLLGLPTSVFPAGAPLFDVINYLRQIAGLGPGNLTPETLAGIIGPAKLSSPYAVAGGEAGAHLRNVLQYLPLRWFVDDREFWICGRDGVPNPYGYPAYVPDGIAEPDLLLTRPTRDEHGMIGVSCLLSPQIRPGRLVRLTEAGLALALQGLSPSEIQIAFAQVPPGLYRCDQVSHVGSTTEMDTWTTSMVLRPGVAQWGAA